MSREVEKRLEKLEAKTGAGARLEVMYQHQDESEDDFEKRIEAARQDPAVMLIIIKGLKDGDI